MACCFSSVCIRPGSRSQEQQEKDKAARKLQALTRGKRGRELASKKYEEVKSRALVHKNAAASTVQKHCRGSLGRKKARAQVEKDKSTKKEIEKTQNMAVTKLQARQRGLFGQRIAAVKRQEKLAEAEKANALELAQAAEAEAARKASLPSFGLWGKQRTDASSKIQAISRGRAGRQRAAAIAAGKMTPAWPDPAAKLEKQKMRARKARAEALKNMTYKEYMAEKSEAVKVVQRQVRVVLAKAAVRRRKAYLVSVHAATALQRMQRGVLGRKRRAIKEAERELQRRERMVRAAELAAARKLQAVLIGREVRARFARARAAARAAGSEVPGALRGPTPAGMGKARARAAAAARRALGRLAQVPTAGTGALLARADLPAEESQRVESALTARLTWNYFVAGGRAQVVVPTTPPEANDHDADSEESKSDAMISNPLHEANTADSTPLASSLKYHSEANPKADRPFVELVGLRSDAARAEMKGNRAVGELIKARPGNEWFSVRLVMSGKRVKVRLDNLRFFDPSQSPAVHNDPSAAAHARAVAKAEERAAEAAEAFKLLQEDEIKGLLDQPPPSEPAFIEGPGAMTPRKTSSLAVSWAMKEAPDPMIGRITDLDDFFESRKANDLLMPLHSAKAAALKATKAKAKSGATPGRVAGVTSTSDGPTIGAGVITNAPVAAEDKLKFEAGLKALKAKLSALDAEEDVANGEIYLHTFEKARVRGVAWLEGEAKRLFTVCGAPNLSAEKKESVIKRMNVYSFVVEIIGQRFENETKIRSGPPPSQPLPLSSVAHEDILALFKRAIATVGLDRNLDAVRGLQFNLDTLDRAYCAASNASPTDSSATCTYIPGRFTQPQLEAGWGLFTGRGGSTDLEVVIPAAAELEATIRADQSESIAKAAIEAEREAKRAKKAAADEKKAAKEAAAEARKAALIAARGPGWSALVDILAPHAKAFGGLDDVARGNVVNGALLDALTELGLTSTAAVVGATDKQLRLLPGFNPIRVKKLKIVCRTAEIKATEFKQQQNSLDASSKAESLVRTKEIKAREKAERARMRAEDVQTPSEEELAHLREEYERNEVLNTILSIVNEIESIAEKKRRLAQIKASKEKRREKKRLEDEAKAAELAAKVEAEAKKRAAKAAIAARVPGRDRKAKLDTKAKASPVRPLSPSSNAGPRLTANSPPNIDALTSNPLSHSSTNPLRATSAPRAFMPPEARGSASTPTSVAGRDSSLRSSYSPRNIVGDHLPGALTPLEERSERGSTASARSSRVRQQSHRSSVSVDRAEARLSVARRERFAESPVKEAAQPTPRLLTKPAGSKLLAAMGSFSSGRNSRGVDTQSTMPPEREDNAHKKDVNLNEIKTAPRTSVSLGRTSSENAKTAVSSSRLFAVVTGRSDAGITREGL